jgi:hypothetical protein
MTSAVDIIIHAVSPESTLGSAGASGAGAGTSAAGASGVAVVVVAAAASGETPAGMSSENARPAIPSRSARVNVRNIGIFLKFFTFLYSFIPTFF